MENVCSSRVRSWNTHGKCRFCGISLLIRKCINYYLSSVGVLVDQKRALLTNEGRRRKCHHVWIISFWTFTIWLMWMCIAWPPCPETIAHIKRNVKLTIFHRIKIIDVCESNNEIAHATCGQAHIEFVCGERVRQMCWRPDANFVRTFYGSDLDLSRETRLGSCSTGTLECILLNSCRVQLLCHVSWLEFEFCRSVLMRFERSASSSNRNDWNHAPEMENGAR